MASTLPDAPDSIPQRHSEAGLRRGSMESDVRPWREVGVAVAAALVSVAVALWKVGGPSALSGMWGRWDYTTTYAGAHTLARQLWITPNDQFGFPFVQDFAHYPTPDLFHLLTLKALALIAGDPFVAANLFVVVGFGFVAIGAYALFRVLRFPPWISFALAVSFSLLPWHFDRFLHAFLSNYASVPIGLIIVVAVASWNLGIAGPERGRTRDIVIVLLLGVYVGLAGAYYAAFISILAVVTIIFQIFVGRRGRDLLPAFWLALVPLIVTQVAAYSYRLLAVTPAPATSAFARSPEESQLFGGAIFTLVRTTGLWSEALTVPGLQYVATVNSAIEADARNSTVGLVAVVLAFVVSAMVLVRNGRYRGGAFVERFGYWPWLFMVSILFFAVGGFGQAFSALFLFQIRSWGRFAIVAIAIAYVILGILICLWLDRSRRRSLVTGVVVAAVLAITALDMVTSAPPVDTAVAERDAAEVRDLGRQIDAAVPNGCGIFELPAYSFPEGVPGDGTPTYEPMIPSFFSEHARWSYGGIRGTQAGTWSVADVSSNVPTLIEQVSAAGFCGILVDTAAYSATADSPIDDLTAILGQPIATSTSGRWQLFSVDGAATGTFTKDYVLNPVRVSAGFGLTVNTDAEAAHHSIATIDGTYATLFVENPRAENVTGTVEFDARAVGCSAPTTLTASTIETSTESALSQTEVSTVEVPVSATAGGVSAVHLKVDPTCEATGDGAGVRIIDPRFIPN